MPDVGHRQTDTEFLYFEKKGKEWKTNITTAGLRQYVSNTPEVCIDSPQNIHTLGKKHGQEEVMPYIYIPNNTVL